MGQSDSRQQQWLVLDNKHAAPEKEVMSAVHSLLTCNEPLCRRSPGLASGLTVPTSTSGCRARAGTPLPAGTRCSTRSGLTRRNRWSRPRCPARYEHKAVNCIWVSLDSVKSLGTGRHLIRIGIAGRKGGERAGLQCEPGGPQGRAEDRDADAGGGRPEDRHQLARRARRSLLPRKPTDKEGKNRIGIDWPPAVFQCLMQ